MELITFRTTALASVSSRAFVRCTDLSIEVQQLGACPITRATCFPRSPRAGCPRPIYDPYGTLATSRGAGTAETLDFEIVGRRFELWVLLAERRFLEGLLAGNSTSSGE